MIRTGPAVTDETSILGLFGLGMVATVEDVHTIFIFTAMHRKKRKRFFDRIGFPYTPLWHNDSARSRISSGHEFFCCEFTRQANPVAVWPLQVAVGSCFF